MSYLSRQTLLQLLQLEQGLGEFLAAQNTSTIKNIRTVKPKKSKPKLQQEIIEKLSEPVIEIVQEPVEQPKPDEKLFGVISQDLVENLSEHNTSNKRIQTIEEIANILAKNINIQSIQNELDDFINFIIKYINDNNENVAAVAIQILNKVLSTVNLIKQFEPKRLVPLLIKKYAEKSKRVRVETTEAFKHLLKIFRIKKFLELLVPYLQYPHFNIKQEIMNLMIYSFLTSKGSAGFDMHSTVKGLAQLLNDKSLKVRFIALESIAYMTTIEDSEKILKVISKEMSNNKNVVRGVQKRFKIYARVKLNSDNQVEYPSLEENPDILDILQELDDDYLQIMAERLSTNTGTNFQKSQRLGLKDPTNTNYFQSSIKFTGKNSTPKESNTLQTHKSLQNFSALSRQNMYESTKDTKSQFSLPVLVESKQDEQETEQIKRQSKNKMASSVIKSTDDMESHLNKYKRNRGSEMNLSVLNRKSSSSQLAGMKSISSRKSPVKN
ncbi:protein fam179b [Stylonychia lemnae]|uniref:Protein fam179b n=1 Tax=Stylonychia lemnae TaxID=5949 RepID=A0A078A9E6_STYLE|nr:protein fam179b [Stylonychia lemnae]|eukprot:CDW78481.1 protein fam179b [Stylonychia lemnae]